MRNIPAIYDNPLDNFFIEISDITTPYTYNLGSIVCINFILF